MTNLKPCNLEFVTFGDGAKGIMMSSGLLKVLGMPKLENVLIVDTLKTNIINISQLCDHNLFVKFTKNKFSMVYNFNKCVMEGERLSNNYYLLTYSGTCYTTLLNNSNIWHRRLNHINHKNLNETIATNVVLGILKMKIDLEKVCGPCEI